MSHNIEAVHTMHSIIDREQILAPEDYVSVFHETTAEALPRIDRDGLRPDVDDKNIGSSGAVSRNNTLIDSDRPEDIVALGISRTTSIYAYPFLAEGHGLYGADQRYINRDRSKLEREYESVRKYGAEVLASMGITTADEYVDKMQDPVYLRQEYPGEILELKVDPAQCVVGDLTEVTNLFSDIGRWGFEKGDAKKYWTSLVTLSDFLKWYKKPEWSDDGNSVKDAGQFRDGKHAMPERYCPIAGAPDNFPEYISQPEILIPDNVPQEHIRLVQ